MCLIRPDATGIMQQNTAAYCSDTETSHLSMLYLKNIASINFTHVLISLAVIISVYYLQITFGMVEQFFNINHCNILFHIFLKRVIS